ncbi:MAG TPA: hypothetical protein VIY66_04745 [Candidatus Acidoferrales bacterium]
MARPSIAFVSPFSFRGGVAVFPSLPISICPRGIAVDPSIVTEGTQKEFVAFEHVSSIQAIDRDLVVNGRVFAVTASEAQAAKFAKIVKRLKDRSSQDRSVEIERDLSQSLDADLIQSKLEVYVEKTSDLSFDSLALFITIFFVSPIVVWRWGLVRTWPFLLCSVALIVGLTAWDYYRTNQELFPASSASEWRAIASILLSPPTAMHATKYLARDFGRDYHPLALAAARCRREDVRSLASRVLRDLRFPRETSEPTDRLATDCTNWFAHQLENAVSSLLREAGQEPEELIAPPLRESGLARSYCPRCLCQFVISEGQCTDCGGIPLCSFTPVLQHQSQ